MALTPTQVTLLTMLISKAADVAVQFYNKKSEELTPEEMEVLIQDEETLTNSLVDEFNSL
jgi:hypothetical protein